MILTSLVADDEQTEYQRITYSTPTVHHPSIITPKNIINNGEKRIKKNYKKISINTHTI
jgi:hypothetical protein